MSSSCKHAVSFSLPNRRIRTTSSVDLIALSTSALDVSFGRRKLMAFVGWRLLSDYLKVKMPSKPQDMPAAGSSIHSNRNHHTKKLKWRHFRFQFCWSTSGFEITVGKRNLDLDTFSGSCAILPFLLLSTMHVSGIACSCYGFLEIGHRCIEHAAFFSMTVWSLNHMHFATCRLWQKSGWTLLTLIW